MMVITNEWLVANQTGNGSWTYAQLEAIGVSVPPKTGWKRSVIGRHITDDQAARFVDAANIICNKGKKKRRPQRNDYKPLFD